MPQVNGQVHTHSTYATAWAARGEPIPCVLTMMGDEFGGEIPIGPFALIGDDSIGRGIVETLRAHRSTAVLMQNHGVFTIGRSAKAAVKSAVLCEEVARTVHVSRQLGDADPHPAIRHRLALRALPERLRAEVRTTSMTPQCWFLTGSQGLYGPEIVEQVEESRAADRRRAERRRRARRRDRLEAGADRRRVHPPDHAGGELRPGLRRRDRLDAHLLAGQDVDRRTRRAADAAAAPAHPGRTSRCPGPRSTWTS